MSMKPDEILIEAGKLFKARNGVYGDNYFNVGAALAALFPRGVHLLTEDDHLRFHIYMLILVKLSRYANNWKEGHRDSIHDAIVYCAMLESIDFNVGTI